jgi:glycosyltransferase involved in cell wall biosynthesis
VVLQRPRVKILFLNDFFGYWNTRVCVDQARYLQRKGHTVGIVGGTLRTGGLLREEWEGFPVYSYGPGGLHSANRLFRTLYFTAHAVHQFRKRHGLDVILSYHSLSMLSAYTFGGAKSIARVYFLYAPWCLEHEENYKGQKRNGISNLIYQFGYHFRKECEELALKRSRQILVCSEFAKKECERIHPTIDKIQVVYPAADLNKFQAALDKKENRRRLNLPAERFIFYTMRRLVPRMGLVNLVRAFAEVKKAVPHAFLVIGGDGMSRAQLEKEIVELGLQNDIRMVGYINEADVTAYYSACDLFVLPTSGLEGFGLVILEALACGRPVLGTPVGAIPEVLRAFDPDLVFDDASSGAMAKKMIEFAKNPARVEELSTRARAYVQQNYSEERTGRLVERALFEACQHA